MAETRIDCELLVDIMTSEDGVHEVDRITIGENEFVFIKGKNGYIIQICVSEEYVTNTTAKDWMRQLGIDDLILSLFPPDTDLPALVKPTGANSSNSEVLPFHKDIREDTKEG